MRRQQQQTKAFPAKQNMNSVNSDNVKKSVRYCFTLHVDFPLYLGLTDCLQNQLGA